MITVDELKARFKVKEDQDLGPIFGRKKGAVSVWRKQGVPPNIELMAATLLKQQKTAGAVKEMTGETNAGDFVRVPRYQVQASAGNGAIVESEQIVDYLQFSGDWLRTSLGVAPDRLALISVIGDSMSPTYNDGDLILVDTANNRPKSDAVYVIQHEGFLWVKRLNFRFDGSIHIISDNSRYPEQTITGEALERLKIVGRVMWRGGR